MNAREELAKLLTDTSRAYIGEYGAYVDEVEAPHLADAILAAGYRKPYTVSTVAELDALPRLSVVRPSGNLPAVFEKHTMWHEAGSRDLVWSDAIQLPATVLYVGEGEE